MALITMDEVRRRVAIHIPKAAPYLVSASKKLENIKSFMRYHVQD